MGYVPLNNYKYDSGYRRIQTGPDNQGFIVLTSGQSAYGANEGIVVAGSPLSGTIAAGAWDYDSNWRYVPGVSPSQSGSALDPTPYNASGAILDTYKGTRIATRTQVAGAQAANAIGPEANVVQPRQAPLQPRASVTQPEKYMYFGGAAPDNQGYSPYNTPDANTPAEGRTGGPVTHRNYENTLLTNVFGTQGTSDRSQWRYHQPVYCKTYTETLRSQSPGLMSTPLRYIYRGNSTQYNLNYPLNNGFQQLPYDDQTGGCGIPVGCPTKTGTTQVIVGDVLSAVVYCVFDKIEWFNTNGDSLGKGLTYTAQSSDVGYKIYYTVTYPDGSTDTSSVDCYSAVLESSLRYWYQLASANASTRFHTYSSVIDNNGDMYVSYAENSNSLYPSLAKITNEVNLVWRNVYVLDTSFYQFAANSYGDSYFLLDSSSTTVDFLAWQWSVGRTFPIRVYRCRVNKSDGSLVDTVAKDWIPPGSPNANYFNITDVKNDADNNYYCVANLAINSEIDTGCIIKFDENLNIQWCLVGEKIRYRDYGAPNKCESSLMGGVLHLQVNDDGLIGCSWVNTFQYAYHNYFSLSSSGSVLASFRPKFGTNDFATDVNPFQVRSLCRDSEGNVYGIGSYDSSIAVGRYSSVIVYKDTPSDTTVWAKNIRYTFYTVINSRYTINVEANQLLIIDSKLVLVAPWAYWQFTNIHYLLICVFNLNSGVMEQALEIKPVGEFGGNAIIQPMPETTKFIVRGDNGFTLRLDVNDLPADGDYICTDNPIYKYTASGVTPVTSNATFYRFDECGAGSAPGFTSRDLSSYFYPVASPVVTVSGATNGIFRYFAGQDTP